MILKHDFPAQVELDRSQSVVDGIPWRRLCVLIGDVEIFPTAIHCIDSNLRRCDGRQDQTGCLGCCERRLLSKQWQVRQIWVGRRMPRQTVAWRGSQLDAQNGRCPMRQLWSQSEICCCRALPIIFRRSKTEFLTASLHERLEPVLLTVMISPSL